MTVSDSTLNVGGSIYMQYGNTSTQQQSLLMDNAIVTAARMFVADGPHSRATATMTGNSSLTVDDLAIPTNLAEPDLMGHFQLDGGIVQVNNPSTGGTQNQPSGFRLTNGLAEFSSDPTAMNSGTMDITGGVLLLSGDATALIQEYVTGNYLTAYGGSGQILFDFDVTHSGFTTVSAITVPEPSSCILLALGAGVALAARGRRRRRKLA